MSDYGLSAAQRAYDARTPRESTWCPKCEAEEWRQRVLCLLDDAPMRKRDRALYADRLVELAGDVATDVAYYVEGEDGELCGEHAPRKEDFD